jgi:ferric-dicitrate binding protein FerR (iron transport regulator)
MPARSAAPRRGDGHAPGKGGSIAAAGATQETRTIAAPRRPRMRQIVIAALLVATGTAVGFAAAQEARPATRREPILENDHVRVWKSYIEPGTPLNWHRHERGRTLVAVHGGRVKIQQKSGESQTVTWEDGKAYWLDADKPGTEHVDVNDSGRTIEVIVMELKDEKAGYKP